MTAENTDLQKAGGTMRLMGFLTLVFGMPAITSPRIAGQSVMWLIGILIMADGLI